MIYKAILSDDKILEHHGISGQKWGVKHGPPYPLSRQSTSGRKTAKSTNKSKSVSGNSSKSKQDSNGVSLAAYTNYKYRDIAFSMSQSNNIPPEDYDKLFENQSHSKIFELGEAQMTNLSSRERAALDEYTSGDVSDVLNFYKRGLYNKEESKYFLMYIDYLDSAFDKSSLTNDIVAVRHDGKEALQTILNQLGESSVKKDPSLLVGKVWSDKGYLSTTISTDSDFFDKRFGSQFKAHILAPTGTKAIYIGSISDIPYEEELLFAANSQFSIEKAIYDNSKDSWEVWMKCIGVGD